MPIRINLLAESQAAEERRRKDPVKRAAVLAGFVVFLVGLWALTLQFKIMESSSDLGGLQTQWQSIEKEYEEVVQRQRQAIEREQKLAALNRYQTNRFLWGTALNAFQQTLNGLDGIHVARLRTEQTYASMEEPKARGASPPAEAKPAAAMEKISMTVEAVDSSKQAGAQVNRFKELIANVPYFSQTLQQTNGVLLTSLSPPQMSENMAGTFVKFTLQCFFPDKIRR